ncbi:S-Ena type endospore appendage [Bacillus paramycoides]|uniref:Endospore appendages core domain-containing protein n=1 Tax=Bacillus paramycoides TaxID=2026194 RepID=A0A1J9U7U0_9BACI|nr:S-Ena type endospore appendage [Bacillus paramycoides]OJD74830.1 hypothetical protein BAU28_18035 [Bacillus paramycoides]
MTIKNCKPKAPCLAFPCDIPTPCPPPPPPSPSPVCEVICNEICGNILLNDHVATLEIWKGKISEKTTITISLFNSSTNNGSIRVMVTENTRGPTEFTVPPGNTVSATVNDAKSVIIFREGTSILKGTFCLKVCFAFSCGNKNF